MDWFATELLAWFDEHGRRDLPWQQDINAYRVWVSEIMLQQTQVTTVIPYYEKFMARFPELTDLAEADLDDVLHHWTGLGYYARGRNLHKAARLVADEFGGVLPDSVADLEALPGIGRSTAGAIAAISGGIRAPILDGNVKRVLARFHAVPGYPGATAVANRLWLLADEHTPDSRLADYTQAIMDLGATVCLRSRPSCVDCPLAQGCEALKIDATARFPGRKPKKEKPVRQTRWFLAYDPNGACLLEQRPAEGLWGGLWTPPERHSNTSTDGFLEEFNLHSAEIIRTHSAPPFRHTFTHFHLDIEPIFIEILSIPSEIRDLSHIRWYAPGSNEALGLSAPAVKLLASLDEFVLK